MTIACNCNISKLLAAKGCSDPRSWVYYGHGSGEEDVMFRVVM